MAALRCPYCRHTMNLKSAKPGQYKPSCPGCKRAFALSVPTDQATAPVVTALPSDLDEATLAESQPPADNRTLAHDGSPAPDMGDHTEVFSQAPADDVTQAEPAAPRRPAKKADGDMPASLGGYRIEKLLGKGGMGSVYLARQVSLDRPVALKVMAPEIAQNANHRARFTREAYAAAQLVHHNVVQIYDIGTDADTTFFSMEFVKGQSLGDVVKAQKRLPMREAVNFTLQAARGLKFAHDLGLIHRDIKPDNLMLNEQGVVKVADLGLVRAVTAGRADDEPAAPADAKSLAGVMNAEVTQANAALGTPAYMSPEQARDAARVDHRADIYSLGCTLYVMLTGRPVFQGKTVFEVLTKHAQEAPESPDAIVTGLPKDLTAIILKMMAKKPDERYQDLSEVITVLEKFLGDGQTGPFRPTEEHATALEKSVTAFNDAPGAKLGSLTWWAVFGGGTLLALLVLLFSFKWGVGLLALPTLAGLAYFVLAGTRRRDHLFLQARDLVLGSRWLDLLTYGVALLLGLVVLWAIGGLVVAVVIGILAVAIAALAHFVLDAQAERQRAEPLQAGEKLLRELRLKGLSEDAVRQFVCKFGGPHWEEYFEGQFGFPAKLTARQWWLTIEEGKPRPKFGVWREPALNWIEKKLKARKSVKELATLQKIEEGELKAKGVNAVEARERAASVAAAMVQGAAEMKQEAAIPVKDGAPRPRKVNKLLQVHVARDLPKPPPVPLLDRLTGPVGPKVRFLIGALLIAACAFWVNQNFGDLIAKTKQAVKEQTAALTKNEGEAPPAAPPAEEKSFVDLLKVEAKPLDLPGLGWVNSFNVGLAGLLLVLSALAGGGRVSLLALPGAFIAVFGAQLGIPPMLFCNVQALPLGIGAGLIVAGMLFLQTRE